MPQDQPITVNIDIDVDVDSQVEAATSFRFERMAKMARGLNRLRPGLLPDGSVLVIVGSEPAGRDNFLYIMDGWNYIMRLYQPPAAVLSRDWTFPEPGLVLR